MFRRQTREDTLPLDWTWHWTHSHTELWWTTFISTPGCSGCTLTSYTHSEWICGADANLMLALALKENVCAKIEQNSVFVHIWGKNINRGWWWKPSSVNVSSWRPWHQTTRFKQSVFTSGHYQLCNICGVCVSVQPCPLCQFKFSRVRNNHILCIFLQHTDGDKDAGFFVCFFHCFGFKYELNRFYHHHFLKNQIQSGGK